MEKNEKNRPRQWTRLLGLVVLYGLVSIGLSFLTVEYSVVEPYIIRDWWLAHPLIIFVNALFVFLVLLFLHGLFNKVQVPIGLTSALIFAFAFGSKMKIVNRKDPIYFADIVLLREALGIVKEGDFLSAKTLVLLGLGLGLLLVLFFLPLGKYSLSLKKRAGLLLATGALMGLSMVTVYTVDSPLYPYLPTRDEVELNKSLTFQDQGIIYSFFTYRDVNKVERPAPYVNNTVAEYRAAFKPREAKMRPDVVMVMGEAWSDFSKLEGFEFYKGKDPLLPLSYLNRRALKRGDLIVPSFGGGTSNTEYDALTGNSTILLSSSSYSAYSAIRSSQESLARTLSDIGYTTYAFHPGNEWFYNRKNVYQKLGFEKGEFLEDLKDPVQKGRFVSEKAGADHFIGKLASLQDQKAPYFAFYVTIQNHSPYDYEKYQKDLDTFRFKGDLTQEEKISLEAYFEGVRDMNREMLRMVNQVADSPRPTVFFYFGDHLPSLAKGMETLQNIGINIDESSYKGIWPAYRVPYIFWANKAYWAQVDREVPYPDTISANYIPSMILESMGGEKLDPFFYFTFEMRRKMPVLHRFFYFNKEGEIIRPDIGLDPEEKRLDQTYRTWQYQRAK